MSQQDLTIENMFNHKTIERFVDKLKLGENGCIEWNAALDAQGYGAFNITTAPRRTTVVKTHRWVLQAALGQLLPPDIFACHHCDNPACVNPAHLFPGSNMDNVKDMINKGRNQSKLTHKEVLEIRQDIQNGKTDLEISQQYGVSRKNINSLRNGQIWTHV